MARTIELAEVNPLPPSQLKSAVFDEDLQGVARKARQEMGRRIAFGVVESYARYDRLESPFQISSDVRIGILIDAQTRRCVGAEDNAQSLHDAGSVKCLLDPRSYVQQLKAAFRNNRYLSFHALMIAGLPCVAQCGFIERRNGPVEAQVAKEAVLLTELQWMSTIFNKVYVD